MKKFILTDVSKEINGVKLYQIKALTSFNNVKAGDLGGWVEKESNLSHYGDAWIYGDARIFGNDEICWFSKFGSSNRTTTAFLNKEKNILINCGCFYGTLEEFEKKYKKLTEITSSAENIKQWLNLLKLNLENNNK